MHFSPSAVLGDIKANIKLRNEVLKMKARTLFHISAWKLQTLQTHVNTNSQVFIHPTYTHSLTHIFVTLTHPTQTYSLTLSFSPTLTHDKLVHSLTHLLNHCLTCCTQPLQTYSLTHSLTLCLSHPHSSMINLFTHTLTHFLITVSPALTPYKLIYLLTVFFIHSPLTNVFICSLIHLITVSPVFTIHKQWYLFIYSFTVFCSHSHSSQAYSHTHISLCLSHTHSPFQTYSLTHFKGYIVELESRWPFF